MPRVVHEVDVEHEAQHRGVPYVKGRQHGNREQDVVGHVFSEGMDHRCIGQVH